MQVQLKEVTEVPVLTDEGGKKQAVPFHLTGGGVSGDLFRSIDWAKHPLGRPDAWPLPLKTMLNVLFHSQHPMFIWWGPELYQFYNDAYLPSFGLGKHPAAMGQRGADCWPEIWPIIKPQIDIVMNGEGATWNVDHYVPIFRNGKIEDVYWTYGYSPLYDDDGHVAGTLVICTETTQQVKALRSLKESEERLSLALTAGRIGFWDWNLKNGSVFLSDTLRHDWGIDPRTSGYTLEDCLERIHPDDRERVRRDLQKSHAETTGYDIEYRVIRPSGEEIFVHAKGRIFLDENNEPLRLTGITSNMTHRKRAEVALQQAKAKAEESRAIAERAKAEAEQAKEEAVRANQLKSMFLANMSHEIRTPLGAMLGFAELLREPKLSEAERVNYINVLHRNGENLAIIINDILDLSKVEAGHLTLEWTDTYPAQVVRDVAMLLQVKAQEKGLAFHSVADATTPTSIISDPTRVGQILLNLVGNAIKFTQSGSINIRSYGQKTQDGLDVLCYAVTDTGIGIVDEEKDKIFEMFVQADGTMTRRFGGTGLGLTLSRSLARSLGGDVALVHSYVGQGSTFLMTIASQEEKRKSARSLPYRVEPRLINKEGESIAGLRILIVDDSPDNQKLIAAFLSSRGVEVDVASNGALGYRKALTGDYHMMIMDIQMPEMDGYTAAYKLRSQGYRQPIIALTAHAMEDIRQKCLASGYTDHLTKPINFSQLLSVIDKYALQNVGRFAH